MASRNQITSPPSQAEKMQAYYAFQAKIYDLTRWSFLFGRKSLIKKLAEAYPTAQHILEVGCGTGYNLALLARNFPEAHITGVDVSTDMLTHAQKATQSFGERVNCLHQAYGPETQLPGPFDIIIFSYSLTMINPQWEDLIQQSVQDLKAGGMVGMVDFHGSKHAWFKTHMDNHHVRMDRHLIPALRELYTPQVEEVKNAYAGLWEYGLFIGKKES